MDINKVKQMVNKYGGEEMVLAMYFNNGYRITFTDKPFSFAENLDEELGMFVSEHRDPRLIPFKLVRDISVLEKIAVAK